MIDTRSCFDCISHVQILPFNTMVEMSIPCCVDLLHIDTLELVFSRYPLIEVAFPLDDGSSSHITVDYSIDHNDPPWVGVDEYNLFVLVIY